MCVCVCVCVCVCSCVRVSHLFLPLISLSHTQTHTHSLPLPPFPPSLVLQVLKYSSQEFVEKQMGMIKEVLTQYGNVSRLWWDHYLEPCGGLSECPACEDPNSPWCFPAVWTNFTSLVRTVSPSTLLGTGPDVSHSGGGETGVGDYPVWNAANATHSDFGPFGSMFLPREADATIQNPGDAWFWKKNHAFWNATTIWHHWLLTVGRGENFILNMPPDTTGLAVCGWSVRTRLRRRRRRRRRRGGAPHTHTRFTPHIHTYTYTNTYTHTPHHTCTSQPPPTHTHAPHHAGCFSCFRPHSTGIR